MQNVPPEFFSVFRFDVIVTPRDSDATVAITTGKSEPPPLFRFSGKKLRMRIINGHTAP